MTAFFLFKNLAFLYRVCYISGMKSAKFAICYNPKIQDSVDLKDSLFEILKKCNVFAEVLDIDNLKCGFDFAFIIGGDGTILRAARFFAGSKTAIFGVNLGRLGFLSQSSKEHLEDVVDKILEGKFRIEERIMLQNDDNLALNDFVIKGSSLARASKFTLKINGNPICDYLADGLIISTPTGSTAYGLSAGGPVVVPGLGVIVIVPICPHTLNARPLVIPDTDVISISVEDREGGFVVSGDGQNCFSVKGDIIVKKSEKTARLALLDGFDFYSVLRGKLYWGTSPAKLV